MIIYVSHPSKSYIHSGPLCLIRLQFHIFFLPETISQISTAVVVESNRFIKQMGRVGRIHMLKAM